MNILNSLQINSKKTNKATIQTKIENFKNKIKDMEKSFSKTFMEKEDNRKFYVSNGFKTRSIWTPVGWCDITRHEYKHILTGKTIRPFDDELGLTKGLKVPSYFYTLIGNITKKYNTYKEAGESFIAPLSSATICEILKKIKL